MTDKVSIVKQKKTLIHLYFLDMNQDECPAKTWTGFQTPLKHSAVKHCKAEKKHCKAL